MSTRNVKQVASMIEKMKSDQFKFNGVHTVTEHGTPQFVSDDHELVLELANNLRALASKILTSERKYAESEAISLMSKNKNELVTMFQAMQADAHADEEPISHTSNDDALF